MSDDSPILFGPPKKAPAEKTVDPLPRQVPDTGNSPLFSTPTPTSRTKRRPARPRKVSQQQRPSFTSAPEWVTSAPELATTAPTTDPTPITPVETRYAGCRFRSRLEARTAVFFDRLRIQWQYEPEGYEIGPEDRRRRYLPDFYLPGEATWVEVKGHPSAVDYRLLADAAHPHHGLPLTLDSRADWPMIHPRVVVLGPPPETPMFHHAISVIDGREPVGQPVVVVCKSGNEGHTHLFQGIGNAKRIDLGDGQDPWTPSDALTPWGYGFPCLDIHDAYTAARSARFEHGESG